MKQYTDLTHEELIVLTENDIERLIDIELAHDGIMPVACPTVPSLDDEGIIKSETVFDIGGLLLKNEEDAIAVSRMEQFKSEYDYNIGYEYRWLNPITERTIIKEYYYRQEDVVRIKEALQRNKIKKDGYESQKQKYDEFLKKTGQIRNRVYDIWNSARNFQREIDDANAVLVKYRDLADDDETMAVNFFKNTYKSREDIIEKVLGKNENIEG